MKVHLIFVTKYRKKIFKLKKRASDIKQIMYNITKQYNYENYSNGNRRRPYTYIA